MDFSKWIGTHPLYQFGGTCYKNLWSNIKRWSGVHTFVYLWALDVLLRSNDSLIRGLTESWVNTKNCHLNFKLK